MVVVAAAALGAAGYGLYKGGEAGVEKGKECHREMQREKKRSSKVASLREKNKTRSSRIAEIVQMKKKGGTPPSATTSTSAAPAFTFSSTNTSTSTSSTTNNNTTRASFAERQLAEKEANSGVDDRHRSVMQKLRSSRQDERKKGSSNNKLRSLNPFKKK